MNIRIDNKEIVVKDTNKNIVEIAEDNGIAIIAPCFRNGRKAGCCKACIIEIDGNQKYACGTKPSDGMNIIYKREDLKESRDVAVKEYIQVLKENKSSSCGCSNESKNNIKPIKDNDSCCGGTSDCCS